MTNQSQILSDFDLKEFEKMAMNIKQFQKKNWNSEKFQDVAIHIQLELNK